MEDWYKKQLPNAKTDDINHNSLYSADFKLNGIKLLSGYDLINIYADTDRNKTSSNSISARMRRSLVISLLLVGERAPTTGLRFFTRSSQLYPPTFYHKRVDWL